MFQHFDPPAHAKSDSARLSALRKAMVEAGVDWYLVPHADEQQNEYAPPCNERLAWLTGFTGSAGFALVGKEQALLFVDGRYTLQAANQVDANDWQIEDITKNPPQSAAAGRVGKGETIGFAPWLLTIAQERDWQKSCATIGASLNPTDNLIDSVWHDRPPAPHGRAWCHPEAIAGQSVSAKLDAIRQTLSKDGATIVLLTDPASVAWAFNLRGSDVAHNPLALAFAAVPTHSRPKLFLDATKLENTDRDQLAFHCDLMNPDALESWIEREAAPHKWHLDPARVAWRLAQCVKAGGGEIVEKSDPVILPRAIKNETELDGMRKAHLRDGVAMARFLAWLDRQAAGSIDEIAAATKLEELRHKTAEAMGSELREIAFDTISGSGPHGAIIHYRVTRATNRKLNSGELYLSDSGGQYTDGTTDITRTIAIGAPPDTAISDFTRVLKGHIAIATARFPEGTRGIDLDPFARHALWQAGKDFAHGTGHGVGAFLNVHEGPQSISRRGMQELKPGMVISNEPGYYKEGAYGIRLENLVIVTEPMDVGGDAPVMGFETITLAPFDRRLIDAAMLRKEEADWLNTYHARVFEALASHLDAEDRDWLKAATAPLTTAPPKGA